MYVKDREETQYAFAIINIAGELYSCIHIIIHSLHNEYIVWRDHHTKAL